MTGALPSCLSKDLVKLHKRAVHIVYLGQRGSWKAICHFRNERGTAAEMRPAIFLGSLLETRRSAIGQFFFYLSLVTVSEVNSAHLFSIGANLFDEICANSTHSLRKYLPDIRIRKYSLRMQRTVIIPRCKAKRCKNKTCLLIEHTFYGFTGVITHMGCWENTRKACK